MVKDDINSFHRRREHYLGKFKIQVKKSALRSTRFLTIKEVSLLYELFFVFHNYAIFVQSEAIDD